MFNHGNRIGAVFPEGESKAPLEKMMTNLMHGITRGSAALGLRLLWAAHAALAAPGDLDPPSARAA
jgi:hypothetical protein